MFFLPVPGLTTRQFPNIIMILGPYVPLYELTSQVYQLRASGLNATLMSHFWLISTIFNSPMHLLPIVIIKL